MHLPFHSTSTPQWSSCSLLVCHRLCHRLACVLLLFILDGEPSAQAHRRQVSTFSTLPASLVRAWLPQARHFSRVTALVSCGCGVCSKYFVAMCVFIVYVRVLPSLWCSQSQLLLQMCLDRHLFDCLLIQRARGILLIQSRQTSSNSLSLDQECRCTSLKRVAPVWVPNLSRSLTQAHAPMARPYLRAPSLLLFHVYSLHLLRTIPSLLPH